MTSMLDILYDFCYHRGYKSCRLDGTMSLEERSEQVSELAIDFSRKSGACGFLWGSIFGKEGFKASAGKE